MPKDPYTQIKYISKLSLYLRQTAHGKKCKDEKHLCCHLKKVSLFIKTSLLIYMKTRQTVYCIIQSMNIHIVEFGLAFNKWDVGVNLAYFDSSEHVSSVCLWTSKHVIHNKYIHDQGVIYHVSLVSECQTNPLCTLTQIDFHETTYCFLPWIKI